MIGGLVCIVLALINVPSIVNHFGLWYMNLAAFGFCCAMAGVCFTLDLRSN